MDTNTIKLHRVFKCSPEKLYKAFLDPSAMCKWLPPNGFTGEVHQMDARVGGTYERHAGGGPGVIPAEMCYLGWQESLNLLALLVEADIPG